MLGTFLGRVCYNYATVQMYETDVVGIQVGVASL